MRNKRFLVGALALAISMLFASSALAVTNVTQTVDGVLGGKEKPKFDKKKFKKTSVKVTTTTADADNPSGMPPKANTAIITFDKKDVKFDSKAVPGCDPNAIENTTTDAARAACGDSEVGHFADRLCVQGRHFCRRSVDFDRGRPHGRHRCHLGKGCEVGLDLWAEAAAPE